MIPENKSHPQPRVLLSGHLPPPLGGIAAFYQSLLNSSLKTRIPIAFVVTSSQSRDLASSGRVTLGNLVCALQDCVRFWRAVRRFKPEIAHIATAFGLSFLKHSVCVLTARLSGAKVLIHPHCSLTVLYSDRSALWRWFFRNVIRLTDGVIALSEEWKELANCVPEVKVFHLPNAIDPTPYIPLARERFEEKPEKRHLRILYLGYLGRFKGSVDLIHAAKQVVEARPWVHFDMVGDELTTGERTHLERILAQVSTNNVRLHRPAYEREKLDFIRRADIFVYPSHHEGMPMAVIEAMTSGLPVVASRVGGLPDLVVDGVNGILVPAGMPDRLSQALIQLIDDADSRIRMQRESHRIAVTHFSIERLVSQLTTIYYQLAGEGHQELEEGHGRMEVRAGLQECRAPKSPKEGGIGSHQPISSR